MLQYVYATRICQDAAVTAGSPGTLLTLVYFNNTKIQ